MEVLGGGLGVIAEDCHLEEKLFFVLFFLLFFWICKK
jgi:hypothetical protein